MPDDYNRLMNLFHPVSWSEWLTHLATTVLTFSLSVMLNAFLGLVLGELSGWLFGGCIREGSTCLAPKSRLARLTNLPVLSVQSQDLPHLFLNLQSSLKNGREPEWIESNAPILRFASNIYYYYICIYYYNSSIYWDDDSCFPTADPLIHLKHHSTFFSLDFVY